MLGSFWFLHSYLQCIQKKDVDITDKILSLFNMHYDTEILTGVSNDGPMLTRWWR